MKRAGLTIACIVAAIIVAFHAWLFIAFFLLFRGDRGTLTDLKKVTEITGLRVPQGAKVIDGTYMRVPNKIYLIGKIRLPKTGVNEFIRQPGLNPPVKHHDELVRLGLRDMQQRGWRPEKAHRVLSGQSNDTTGKPLVVYTIDLDNPDVPVLYLYVHD